LGHFKEWLLAPRFFLLPLGPVPPLTIKTDLLRAALDIVEDTIHGVVKEP
jgi:hypothetical protein